MSDHWHYASDIHGGADQHHRHHDLERDIERAGDHEHPAPAPVLPELDRECGTCNGKGWFHTFDNHGGQISPPDGVTCRDCGGEGHPLTDAGRDLLQFLQRHPPTLTRTS